MAYITRNQIRLARNFDRKNIEFWMDFGFSVQFGNFFCQIQPFFFLLNSIEFYAIKIVEPGF